MNGFGLVGVALALGLLSGAEEPGASGPAAKELERFQGVWRMVSATTDGKAMPEDQAKAVTVTFQGSTHTVRSGDKAVAQQIPFEIDPASSPKTTTDTVRDADGKVTHIKGIYTLEGDTLTSCVGAPGAPRPGQFEAPAGSGRSLRVFKKEPKAVAGPGENPEYAKFEGTWTFASLEIEGKAIPVGPFKNARLVLKGKTFTSVEPDQSVTHGTYVVDTSKSPRTIDTTFTDGPQSGKTMKGVYELAGDTYKLCIGMPGKTRPTGLVSRAGSGHILEVMTRQKP